MRYVPAFAGVPMSRPVFPTLKPFGALPVTVQVSGATPPIMTILDRYAAPAVAFFSFEVLNASFSFTRSARSTLFERDSLSVTVSVNAYRPASDGVPEIVPSFARVTPAGSAPLTDQVYVPEPPPADSLALNGMPTSALPTAPVKVNGWRTV